ncbi:MAG: C25 family cysteine peptidase [Thermoproteota archaeon]|nr:C25 family cysteine peptidase [Thermoproteota archaeon]
MEIFVPALNYSTGTLLYDPIDEKSLAKKIEGLIPDRTDELDSTSSTATADLTFRAVMAPPSPNYNNPCVAGWTYLINKNHPNLSETQKALEPLAKHRCMKGDPLFFDDKANYDSSIAGWQTWIEDNYSGINSDLSLRKPPHYILIIGGPDQVPFGLQALLDIQASVGRIDLGPEELDAYVQKIIRLEKADKTNLNREAFFFATNHGGRDPTYFSYNYMVKPLIEKAQNMKFNAQSLLEKDATKENFLKSLANTRPALVYTASHGVTDPNWNSEMQERMNGAIVDQSWVPNQPLGPNCLITAEDIPYDKPFLEGSIFFQFACFGYGTSADDEFTYWTNKLFPVSMQHEELKFQKDFIGALPKRLLAHPHGPIAFIGHLHLACLQGFDNPDERLIDERWSSRLEPFVYALDNLFQLIPSGEAMADMNRRFGSYSAELSKIFGRIKRRPLPEEDKNMALANAFIMRNDAQNYMLLGDPAARILLDE